MEYLHEASQSDPKESDRNGNFIHHQVRMNEIIQSMHLTLFGGQTH